jgi:hypothetical protein
VCGVTVTVIYGGILEHFQVPTKQLKMFSRAFHVCNQTLENNQFSLKCFQLKIFTNRKHFRQPNKRALMTKEPFCECHPLTKKL